MSTTSCPSCRPRRRPGPAAWTIGLTWAIVATASVARGDSLAVRASSGGVTGRELEAACRRAICAGPFVEAMLAGAQDRDAAGFTPLLPPHPPWGPEPKPGPARAARIQGPAAKPVPVPEPAALVLGLGSTLILGSLSWKRRPALRRARKA